MNSGHYENAARINQAMIEGLNERSQNYKNRVAVAKGAYDRKVAAWTAAITDKELAAGTAASAKSGQEQTWAESTLAAPIIGGGVATVGRKVWKSTSGLRKGARGIYNDYANRSTFEGGGGDSAATSADIAGESTDAVAQGEGTELSGFDDIGGANRASAAEAEGGYDAPATGEDLPSGPYAEGGLEGADVVEGYGVGADAAADAVAGTQGILGGTYAAMPAAGEGIVAGVPITDAAGAAEAAGGASIFEATTGEPLIQGVAAGGGGAIDAGASSGLFGDEAISGGSALWGGSSAFTTAAGDTGLLTSSTGFTTFTGDAADVADMTSSAFAGTTAPSAELSAYMTGLEGAGDVVATGTGGAGASALAASDVGVGADPLATTAANTAEGFAALPGTAAGETATASAVAAPADILGTTSAAQFGAGGFQAVGSGATPFSATGTVGAGPLGGEAAGETASSAIGSGGTAAAETAAATAAETADATATAAEVAEAAAVAEETTAAATAAADWWNPIGWAAGAAAAGFAIYEAVEASKAADAEKAAEAADAAAAAAGYQGKKPNVAGQQIAGNYIVGAKSAFAGSY